MIEVQTRLQHIEPSRPFLLREAMVEQNEGRPDFEQGKNSYDGRRFGDRVECDPLLSDYAARGRDRELAGEAGGAS